MRVIHCIIDRSSIVRDFTVHVVNYAKSKNREKIFQKPETNLSKFLENEKILHFGPRPDYFSMLENLVIVSRATRYITLRNLDEPYTK